MSNISHDPAGTERQEFSSSEKKLEEITSQALAFHNENDLDEAAGLYREVLEIEPGNVQACFNLGSILQATNELSEGIKYFRLALRLEPDNFQVLYCLANCLRDQGSRDEAIELYQRIIELGHCYSDPYYNLGILYYHQGEYDLAMDCYRKALKIDPSHADSFYNLGIIHFEKNELTEAAANYEKALQIRPDDVDTLYNLAFTRAKLGQHERAALHYHQAIEVAPNDPELHNSLGSILRKMNEPELAAICYRQAVTLRPGYGSAWTNLATILQSMGQYKEAIDCYSKAIELGDHTESADFMMAALTGSNRNTPPKSYVRELYDSYADNFEKSLVGNLEYKAPELLRKVCMDLVGEEKRFRKAVDVGCGTGLAGEQFRDMVDHLVGIDISDKMLSKADEKNIYDRLVCDDIAKYFAEGIEREIDLVIAADVLIYIGELGSLFNVIRKVMSPGGHLLFSTEKLESEGTYNLEKTGRYSHSESYIRSLAIGNDFEVAGCREVKLRKEKDEWLNGFVFALRKKD